MSKKMTSLFEKEAIPVWLPSKKRHILGKRGCYEQMMRPMKTLVAQSGTNEQQMNP